MPIEIKELIIRASVQDEAVGTAEEERSQQTSSDTNSSNEERIVNRCVEQVMDILRIQNER